MPGLNSVDEGEEIENYPFKRADINCKSRYGIVHRHL